MGVTRRVVARYLTAKGLGLGQTWENARVRIHRYSSVFKISDLTNAGKRGKKVRVMRVGPSTYSRDEEEQWMDSHSKHVILNAGGGYDGLKRYFEAIEGANISEQMERGVDVRPGNLPEFKLQWKVDGDQLSLIATTTEFLLKSSVPMSHPKTGKPVGRQDTLYYQRNKRDAAAFYQWLLGGGASKIQKMRIHEVRKLWDQIKVKYDFH